MDYDDKGEIELATVDDANIPVNCFVHAPDEESTRWRWTADNLMPRKARVAAEQYSIEADTRETIEEAVRKYVVPLYEAALANLRDHGGNYYWERTSRDQ